MFPGQLLKGFQCVVDEQDTLPLIGSGDLRIVGDGVGRAFFERFGDETVAVEGIAPRAKKMESGSIRRVSVEMRGY